MRIGLFFCILITAFCLMQPAQARVSCEQTVATFSFGFGQESFAGSVAVEFKSHVRSEDDAISFFRGEIVQLVPLATVRDVNRPRTIFLDSAGRQILIENTVFISSLGKLPSVPNVQKQCGGSCYLFSHLYALSQASHRSQQKDLELVTREVAPKEIAENSPLSPMSFENVFFNFLKRIEQNSREIGKVTLDQALGSWSQVEASSRRLKEQGINILNLSQIAPGMKSRKIETAKELAVHLVDGGTAIIGGMLQSSKKAKKTSRISINSQGEAIVTSGSKVEFISQQKDFFGRVKDHFKAHERNRVFINKLNEIVKSINSGKEPTRDQAYELMEALAGENIGHAVSALHYFVSGPHRGHILIYDSAKSTFELYPLAELIKVEKDLVIHGISNIH